MENMDTIHLLKECSSGSRMAVTSIDEVMENVQDGSLQQILRESKEHHEKLGNEIHSLLQKYHSEPKDPGAMAKGMSWLKTNVMLKMDDSDATVADLITEGCNMGVKSLCKYQNQYSAASHESKAICKKLIALEEDLCKEMRQYL